MIGLLLAIEGFALALREYDVAGRVALPVGLALVLLGVVVAAVAAGVRRKRR